MRLLLSVVLIFAATEVHGAAVNLSLYYESLCPDSINFVKFQLYPTWLLLTEDYLSVDFVPYGKATQDQAANGTWIFECQHGERECQGNKEQACALSLYQNNASIQVQFISCVMSTRRPPTAGPQCAAVLGIDYNPVQNCAEGTEGNELLARLGDRTHNFTPHITFVPTVAINGVYTQKDQDDALSNLMSVICRHINGTKPEACNG